MSTKEKQGLEGVMAVRSWDQDVYRKSLFLNLILTLVLIVMLPFTVIGLTKEAQPKYFATNEQGGITPIVPLSEPNLSDTALINWASKAIADSYTMDYVNFRSQVSEATSSYFTSKGGEQFKAAIKDSGNLEALLQRRMIISTIVTSTPVINSKGLSNGVYTWQMDVPIRVTYENSDNRATQDLVARLLVVRESTLEKRHGVAISQFVASK